MERDFTYVDDIVEGIYRILTGEIPKDAGIRGFP
jgi:nucleoside-diphosphate-sugar epimerase